MKTRQTERVKYQNMRLFEMISEILVFLSMLYKLDDEP